MTTIPASAFNFMEQLRANNDREWFATHKNNYLQQSAQVALSPMHCLGELNKYDVIETASGAKSLYRIYRDVRFSKDKTPFSTYWGGRFKRAGKQRRGGYYYHLEPGNRSFILCGFWGPSTADLKLIRDDIAFDDSPLRRILNDPDFVHHFGSLQGEQLKSSPKGYDRFHEAIDLLRFKQFLVCRNFSDEEVLAGNFLQKATESLLQMRPFLDYMSEVLAEPWGPIKTIRISITLTSILFYSSLLLS